MNFHSVPPLSMPWYRADDYAGVRDLCSDLPASFEEWEAGAIEYYKMGHKAFPKQKIEKIIIDAAALMAFAAEIGSDAVTRETRWKLAAKIAKEQFYS